jgi:hypothetical protein
MARKIEVPSSASSLDQVSQMLALTPSSTHTHWQYPLSKLEVLRRKNQQRVFEIYELIIRNHESLEMDDDIDLLKVQS